MEMMESLSHSKKKLKQAQLPFVVINNKDSPQNQRTKKTQNANNTSFNESEEKENQLPSNERTSTSKEKKSKIIDCENMIVDLTDEKSRESFVEESSDAKSSTTMSSYVLQTIEQAIEAVVKRSSNEFQIGSDGLITSKENASAKKRRRRSKSLSPLPPDAKRPILSEESKNSFNETSSSDKQTPTKDNPDRIIPKIVVTTATPLGRNKENARKPLIGIFEETSVSKEVGKKSEEKCVKVTERKTSRHPPLSSVIGIKRSRSRSPVRCPLVEIPPTVPVAASAESDVTSSKKIKPNADQDPVKQEIPSKPIEVPVVTPIKDEEIKVDICQSPPASKSRNSSQLETPSPPEKPSTSRVTPKSSGKKMKISSAEAQRKREEKEREKEEKRKQKEEQRLAKEKEKLEIKRKKDEEKAQKEEERRKKKEEEELVKAEKQKQLEEKRREKEKIELEKKLEREKKEEERRKEKEKKEEERRKEKERKEEEKRQKELEKQRIEEEKQHAEEEKRRKSEKRAETFKSFFKSPARSPSTAKHNEKIGIFVPFQLKQDMCLAPLHRAKITSDQKKYLENVIDKQNFASCYLKQCSDNKSNRRRPMPTMPKLRRKLVSLSEDGLELVEDGESKPGIKILRAKFLYFHSNYRPPYYGTWRKESKLLSYKNPFRKDEKLFEYEFDSDDEWEEPADGEDIANSEEEDEGEGNEEDEDDGFFVPHGYLSDDEGINGEEDDCVKPGHKLKQKQLEFEASFKRKLSALTPIVIGCVWKDSAESISQMHKDMLSSYKTEILCSTPIQIHPPKANAEKTSDSPTETPKSDQTKKYGLKAVPNEAMYDLVRLLHGNALSLARIVAEFRTYWKLKNADDDCSCGPLPLNDSGDEPMEVELSTEPPQNEDTPVKSGRTSPVIDTPKSVVSGPKVIDASREISKTQLLKKCKEIAVYCKRDNINRSCWLVHDSILEKYELGSGKAPIPCKWRFVTDVPKILVSMANPALINEIAPEVAKQSPGQSIAKFVAKVSPADILEKSKLKYENSKQAAVPIITPTIPVSSISKYTTEKISPVVIIEKSAQRIAEELTKAKEAMKASEASAPPQEGTFVIPTQEAIKSLFRVDSSGNQTQENKAADSDEKSEGKEA